MHSLLAAVLKSWQQQTLYSKPEDYVFASYKIGGKKPRVGSMIVEDYLRPAAVKAGVIKVGDDGFDRLVSGLSSESTQHLHSPSRIACRRWVFDLRTCVSFDRCPYQ